MHDQQSTRCSPRSHSRRGLILCSLVAALGWSGGAAIAHPAHPAAGASARLAPAAPSPVESNASRSTTSGDSCSDLMRELKLLTFDREWERVESIAGRVIDLGPDCEHQAQASRLLAQALDRQGQLPVALDAYLAYLDTWCDGAADPACSRTRTDSYRLASTLYARNSRQKYLDVLFDGLERTDDSGLVAALYVADLPDPRLRKLALPRLQIAYDSDLDSDVHDRICLAMIKIDPQSAECAQKDPTPSDDARPELISVEVFDKATGKPELRVNMPVALAAALIRALPEDVLAEMAKSGVDIREIFKAIRDNVNGTLFEAETEDMKVRIWLQ